MFIRGQNASGLRVLGDVLFLLCGVGVLVIAIYRWSDCGFIATFTTWHHRGQPDPCGYAKWVTLVGVVISGYSGFSLASTFVNTDSKGEGNDTQNI
jgi:hypothetical protein